MAYQPRTCDYCGETFTPKYQLQKRCLKPKPCQEKKKEEKQRESNAKYAAKRAKQRPIMDNSDKERRECPFCEELFIVRIPAFKHCSSLCALLAKEEQQAQEGAA